MKNLKIVLTLCVALCVFKVNAQTKEELKRLKAEKQSQADVFQGQVDSIQSVINALPGWRIGAFGTIGGSLSRFNNWFAQSAPNNESGNIGFTVNGYAHKIESAYFWRNNVNMNLGWTKLDDEDNPNDNEDFEPTIDVFNVSSLFGYRLNKSLSASTLAEYRTTLLDNINDPGYLDIGLGITWTPITDLVVVVHPANYNFVFSEEDAVFESSLGAKLVADYTKALGKLNFKTNLSAFQSYEDSNLSNWTWINSFAYSIWKGIGLGLDFGLRSNHQEAVNFERNRAGGNSDASFDNVDNEIQTYYTVGASYSF